MKTPSPRANTQPCPLSTNSSWAQSAGNPRLTFIVAAILFLLLSTLYCLAPAFAAPIPVTAAVADAEVKPLVVEFMNRPVFTIRSGVMGYSEVEREMSIKNRIKAAMAKGGDDHVSLRATPENGRFIELNGLAVFQIRPTDINPLIGETVDEVAQQAAENLKLAVQEAREQNNGHVYLVGVSVVATMSLLLFLVCRLLFRWEDKLTSHLQVWMSEYEDKLSVALHPQQVLSGVLFLIRLVKWALLGVVGYQWASISLSQFPYSRPWGEKLNGYLLESLAEMCTAILGAVPGLIVVAFIILLTRFTSRLLKAFFARIETGEVVVAWMAEETAKPTRKITQALLWLFAFAMAYPYFPGSNTEAFKGLSVLVGIMLSIGGAGVVGQAASGLIMIYSRVLREGEYVTVGNIEGLVTTVGIFATKIQTASGEEVNIPNAVIGSSTTINSSRLAVGQGLVAHTTVTIGYNTPWRQVQAMLLNAAALTDGLCTDPKPYVSQTALSDFYIEYRLCVQIQRPEIRRATLTALHAHIQDVFNEYGVQIMSPHYECDPAEKVWVPKAQWYAEPADSTMTGDNGG